jgi:hypothetical protein
MTVRAAAPNARAAHDALGMLNDGSPYLRFSTSLHATRLPLENYAAGAEPATRGFCAAREVTLRSKNRRRRSSKSTR